MSLDINSQQTTYTVTTQDVSRSGLDALFVQEFNSLHVIVDEMSNLRCKMNKNFKQNVLALMGNDYSHSIFIGKEGVIGLHAESAGAIIYVHHCAKIIVELFALNYCTDEVPIIVTQNDSQSFVCYMNAISKDFYKKFTLIKCNPLFPNIFQLGNASWIAFGQNLTIVEKPQVLSYLEERKREVPIFKEVFNGFFTEKQLEESRLAQMYRQIRRTITV